MFARFLQCSYFPSLSTVYLWKQVIKYIPHSREVERVKQKQMFSCNTPAFFNDPMDVGNLISGSSAFSKTNLKIWKFLVHVLLKSGLENFEHYFASV